MKIIVLAGGLSRERDVSLLSGAGICKTLRENGHKAYLLDVYFGIEYDSDKLEEVFELSDAGLAIAEGISTIVPDIEALKKSRAGNSDCYFGPNVLELCKIADITFMAMHGCPGEDGKIQAAFDLMGIKYTGPNYLGCALAMNKLVTKHIFKKSDVVTPRGTLLNQHTKNTPLSELGYYPPLVIKPCDGGSSIGVFIVNNEEEYKNAIYQSFEVNGEKEVVIEPYIKGREFACGIIAGKALPIIEIVPKDGVFDYANKYQAGGAREICPTTAISEEMQLKMQHVAERAFEVLRLDVYSRVDFIVSDEDDAFYCLEVNSLPGMTPSSLLPKEACAAGLNYNELCETIIAESIKARYK